MEDEDNYPVPCYTFSIVASQKPEISQVLISSSLLTSCYGLSLFKESSKIGQVSVRISNTITVSTLQVATLYCSNSILFINPNEKLRSEFAIHFTEYLFTENWLCGDITVLDSICENDFIGKPSSLPRYIFSSAITTQTGSRLESGNSLKGISAAVMLTCEANNLKGKCIISITSSYELCEENLQSFSVVSNTLALASHIPSAIYRIEQERYKHQIYS